MLVGRVVVFDGKVVVGRYGDGEVVDCLLLGKGGV